MAALRVKHQPLPLGAAERPQGGARVSRRGGLGAARRFLARNPLALVGGVILLFWIAISLGAPLLTPRGPLAQDVVHRLQEPSLAHPFGTDALGRDILSRVIYGGRISLPVGFLAVAIALVIGGSVGATAGFGPRWLDGLLMRLTEMVMGFPPIVLAMAIAAALGPGLVHTMIALVAVSWPRYARVLRGLVLSVLPNCLGPAVVMASLDLGNAILAFSGLSFLGLGSPPPAPEWGAMVAAGTQNFDQWWVGAFPGLAILTLVMAFNFIGDGLRDALDPRLRRSL